MSIPSIPVRLERTMDVHEPGWSAVVHLPAVPRVGEHLEVTDAAGETHTGTVRGVMWPLDLSTYDGPLVLVHFR